MTEKNSIVAEQFVDAAQQNEATALGLWTFIATEILFFGGLFLAYAIYRHFYYHEFDLASRRTDLFFGTLNSVILLTSSLTMVLAVQAAKRDQAKMVGRFLSLTIFLGASFLVVKAFEYHKDIADQLVPGEKFNAALPPAAQLFFWLYWAMTGLHAIHILIGMGLLSVMFFLTRRGRISAPHFAPLELTGLYWHFVDIVWLFLYPLLYLVNRHA